MRLASSGPRRRFGLSAAPHDHCVDLDELAGVAERSRAEQCRRRYLTTEPSPHRAPRRAQTLHLPDDVDCQVTYIVETETVYLDEHPQIAETRLSLCSSTATDECPRRIQWHLPRDEQLVTDLVSVAVSRSLGQARGGLEIVHHPDDTPEGIG